MKLSLRSRSTNGGKKSRHFFILLQKIEKGIKLYSNFANGVGKITLFNDNILNLFDSIV